MSDDLSDYERIRLENIKRNEEFLQNLGLSTCLEKSQKKSKADGYAEKKKLRAKEKRTREVDTISQPALGTRSSKRLREKKEDEEEEVEEEEEEEEEEGGIDYERMPFEPSDLDDHEFKVFVRLKSWRLEKSRVEECEAYKIFPNRVLAEIIRRKRNDPNWASAENREQCIECWGIAAAKFSTGNPTALLEIMEEDEHLVNLEASRRMGSPEA